MLLLSWFSVSFAKVLPSSFISFICFLLPMLECFQNWKWVNEKMSAMEYFDRPHTEKRRSCCKKCCGNGRYAALTIQRYRIPSLLSFFSFLFHFHVSPKKHVCQTFVRFLRSDAACFAPLPLPFYVFLFRWATDMCATRCEYSRKHLDAFKNVMDVWWRDERRENIQRKINVKWRYVMLVHLDYHYADSARLISCSVWFTWDRGTVLIETMAFIRQWIGATLLLIHTWRGISKEDRKNGKRKWKSFQVMASEIHQARTISPNFLLTKLAPETCQYCGYLVKLAIRIGGMWARQFDR